MLNVRDLAAADALENHEISALIKILGMSFDRSYANVAAKDRGLRYGRVLIMADQDVDGSHIKGLIINMFHKFWPELLKCTDGDTSFVQSFITPLVKARKGKVVKEFFNVAEFDSWQNSNSSPDGVSDGESKGKWHIKYYKGLGTSTAEEGKQYFGAFEKHRRSFVWQDATDDATISMAFAKDKANERKEWLLQAAADSAIKASAPSNATIAPLTTALTYKQFIDTELVEFSRADLLRSIPSVLDGLKPSQRKVLFACFKRTRASAGVGGTDLSWLDGPIDSDEANDVKALAEDNRSEVKVSQLAGYVAEHTAYHHGEASLLATIVNMAQDFVGTNNIPLLSPLGQFGTRLQGGKDAASARYIFTKLAPIARHIYPSADDALLKQREDDGMLVEPIVFLPIIPMVLVNGAQGIGTGWSTFVPPHHPLDVVDGLSRAIASNADTAPTANIKPWWRSFTGTSTFAAEGVVTRGKATWISEADGTNNSKKRKRKTADADVGAAGTRFIRISELPIGRWTDDYKGYLLGLVEKGLVDEVKEYHTESTVDFVLQLTLQGMQEADKHPDSLESFLKLSTAISLRNMHLFSEKGSIQKYPSAASILQAFVPARRELYAARLHRLSVQLSFELLKQQSRLRFLEEVNTGKLRLQDHSRTELLQMLASSNFPAFDTSALCTAPSTPPIATKYTTQLINWEALRHGKITMKSSEKAPENLSIETALASTGFDYLLNTPLVRLTNDSMTKTKAAVEHLSTRQKQLSQLSASDLWVRDLKTLRGILEADPTYNRA
jgi:DNA topoisomerase-2